ncbi:TIR domain-containing protein [Solirubrobacter pauli]|nr:TIR domain-containing protein [Solirubrobacter pauli]
MRVDSEPPRGKAFAYALRAATREAGLTQAQLAHLIGVTRYSIVRWLGGEGLPSQERMRKLEDALDLQTGELAAVARFDKAVRVFLCHASEDKPTVEAWEPLLDARGYDVWLDSTRLLPGDDWELEIRRAVWRADIVLVAMSSRSTSKVGFVQREIRLVLEAADERPEGTSFVIPVRLDDSPVPMRLERWQWIDARQSDWLDRIDAAVQKLLGAERDQNQQRREA